MTDCCFQCHINDALICYVNVTVVGVLTNPGTAGYIYLP